ncbi:MAG: sigma-70 family RNA polymerase sigma factor [Planctomycetia bacterium]|nr:sigma-70 family RNA polymerase sigma factor [Planctomycetia bacterium]
MDQPLDTSDHELMRRCRNGDAWAFEALVRRWQAPVGRMVSHLLGPAAEVDDLCQEVFVRILRARERYRPSHSFSTWLYRITLNVARDSRRRQERRPSQSLVSHDARSPAPTPAEALARDELADTVAAAVAALPDELREVLVLKHFGRLSFSEVALATGLPLSTAKSRVQAALKQLRGELRRRGITDGE